MTEEVRSISSTGAEKGVKLAMYSAIPAGAILEVAQHYGKGSFKYEKDNWRRGYEWSKSYDALNRHLWQFWNGEDFDEETGSKHIIAVAWHALALATFMDEQPGFDDRFSKLLTDDIVDSEVVDEPQLESETATPEGQFVSQFEALRRLSARPMPTYSGLY